MTKQQPRKTQPAAQPAVASPPGQPPAVPQQGRGGYVGKILKYTSLAALGGAAVTTGILAILGGYRLIRGKAPPVDIFDKPIVPTYVELMLGHDMDDGSFLPGRSYAWVRGFVDENMNGRKDPGEEAVYFGVREGRQRKRALKQVGENIRDSPFLTVSRPIEDDPQMATDRPLGVRQINGRLVVDEDLVTGYTARGL